MCCVESGNSETEQTRINCLLIVIALMVAGIICPAGVQADSTGNVNLLIGQKNLEESDWEPLDQHKEFGVDVDWKSSHWPLSLTLGILASKEEDTIDGINFEGKTSELYFGIRKVFDDHPVVRPFLGVGVASVHAELEGSANGLNASDEDSAFGIWFGGGLYLTVAKHLNLGFDFRYSKAEVDLFGVDGEAGGIHYHFLIGYHW